jgi:hypothetical protein
MAEEGAGAAAPQSGVSPTQSQDDFLQIVGGFGLVISPGYNSTLNDAYSDDYAIEGGYGWLDLMLGIRLNVVRHFSITPGANLLVNFVSGDESFVNTIVLPGVGARYMFKDAPSLYVNGEVNYGFPNTGGRIESNGGGVGFGGAIGFDFDGVDISLGYVYIPVEIAEESTSPMMWIASEEQTTENFGGFILKVMGAF